MKFRRQQRAQSGIDITPLIDVVFLMLIFFMVSTTFTREAHLELSLPEAEAIPANDSETRLELVVTASGNFSLNGKALVNGQLQTIMSALRQESDGDTSQPVVVTADANTPHEFVVRAMDAAGRLGFSRLSITTRLPDEGASG